MERFRNIVEVAIGALYAMGAFHQLAFVLRDAAAFYGDMAAQSWIPPARILVKDVLIPNSATATIGVGILEAILAIAILTRGSGVRPALIVGGLFSIAGAATGGPAETAGYGLLAILQFWLAARHDNSAPMETDLSAADLT